MAANSFPLLAAPLFILMGNIMNSAGITERIFDFAAVCVGWMRGGLCHANIVGTVIFAGMTGSAVADAGGLGTVEIEAMKDAATTSRRRRRSRPRRRRSVRSSRPPADDHLRRLRRDVDRRPVRSPAWCPAC